MMEVFCENCFVQIYDNELESIPEFEKFEDNIKKFKIYGFSENNKTSSIAILKVIIMIF